MKLSHLVVASSIVASANAFAPPMQRRAFMPIRTAVRMSEDAAPSTEEEAAPVVAEEEATPVVVEEEAPAEAEEEDSPVEAEEETATVEAEEEAAPVEEEAAPVVAESAMPDAESAYDRLGVPEDKLAIGIDPSDVLQWLGTREDIISKFLRDNKKFDQERAETEVDKFLLDAEMVQAYINFEKRKALEGKKTIKEEAMENLSDPKTIATYVAWILGGVGFSLARKYYVEPKYASGEWEPIHIDIGAMFGDPTAKEAASDAIQGTVDAAQSAVDSATSAL